MSDGSRVRAGSGARTRWWTSRWVLGAVLAVLALVFILENRQTVEIRVLIPILTMPLWAALTGMVVVGVLIGVLVRRR